MLPFIILAVFLFSVALAVSPTSTPLIPNGGAGSSCHNFAIVANTADISAQCRDVEGNDKGTRLTLSNCLGNQDGQLGCQKK